MRIAIVTESFLPTLNGVTTSVCRVLDELAAAGGHDAVIVCPGPAPARYLGFRVITMPSVTVRDFRVGLATPRLERVLREFAPDVVHVASPFGLGARALALCHRLGLPSVAIYQTDMPAYLAQHGGPMGPRARAAAWRWVRRLHAHADLTLAPSTAAARDLAEHDVERVALWARGVDTDLFDPAHRDDAEVAALRERVAPNGEVVVGYVGRLAPEKELARLADVADLPGTRLVIVGEGPSRHHLERLLPRAHFLGRQEGLALARSYAAFDVFVHTGTKETFGQTLQEAMASGLPVVAPAAGGPLDIVKPGVTGLLFDPSAPTGLREAVGGLVADAALRTRMGESAHRKMAVRSWADLVEQLLAHYRTVADRRVGASARAA